MADEMKPPTRIYPDIEHVGGSLITLAQLETELRALDAYVSRMKLQRDGKWHVTLRFIRYDNRVTSAANSLTTALDDVIRSAHKLKG